MKITFLLPVFVCLLSGSVPAFGQGLRSHSLSLSAEAVSVGGSTAIKDSTHSSNHTTDNHLYGMGHNLSTNQTQTSTTSESVQISVRNFGTLPETAHLEWYFVAMPVKIEPGTVGDPRRVFDQGTKEVSIAGNGNETFTADSQEITATSTRKNTARYRATGRVNVIKGSKPGGVTQSGSKVSGWVVRLMVDGKVIETKGSSQDLEFIAKDEAKLKALQD